MKSPLRDVTEGALEGIAELDLGKLEPGALVIVLTAVGDALRLGIPLPPEVSRGLKSTVSERDVLAALGALTASVEAWSLPAVLDLAESDPGLAWALQGRDEVESILAAARRVLLPRGVLVDVTPEATTLAAAVAAHDLSCGGKLPRSCAEQLLGDRLELVDAESWLDAVKWADEAEDADAEQTPMPDLSKEVPPDLQTLEAYVVEGRFRTWVEAWAERSKDVAETLEDMIATYREEGATVSLVARRWHRARGNSGSQAPPSERVHLVLRLPQIMERAAAADDELLPDAGTAEVSLGVLAPLDAVARLVVRASDVTLKVYPGHTALSEVRLGATSSSPPTTGNTWAVTVRRSELAAPLSLAIRVVDGDGRVFEDRLVLETDVGPG